MIRWLALLLVFPVMTGCDSIAYYAQAVQGQAAILLGREPIQRLVADPLLEPRLREQLLLVESARDFAEAELGLDAAGSFTTYVDPGRQHIVWNVFAAPWNSVDLISWCFPIAGCVAYRGYFSEQAATQYARRLAAQGYDVFVGGVDAYSTLGWFKDPLPATVLRRSDSQLAGLVFHELSHQRIYVPGDTRFNESFATFVEQQGLRLWLHQQGRPEQFAGVTSALDAQQGFADFVIAYREQFRQLYAMGGDNAAELAEQKQQLFEQMRSDWQQRPDADGYRGWFAGELNNAKLATVGAYFDWVPAFEQIYADCDNSLEDFYLAVERLAKLPAAQRTTEIERLQALRLQITRH
ncbi:MAG: aminopeptidase [Pseudohongiella sp.]|nr:aminopeptidase [Pseudohongiella sp.]